MSEPNSNDTMLEIDYLLDIVDQLATYRTTPSEKENIASKLRGLATTMFDLPEMGDILWNHSPKIKIRKIANATIGIETPSHTYIVLFLDRSAGEAQLPHTERCPMCNNERVKDIS